MEGLSKAKKIAQCLYDKKGKDIIILNVSKVTTLCDYFVIATGGSTPQIKAMTDEVIEKLESDQIEIMHIEGYDSASWVLLDYEDVIVHIFNEETRSFYAIERLWTDTEEIQFAFDE